MIDVAGNYRAILADQRGGGEEGRDARHIKLRAVAWAPNFTP
jgi:hypothetical protein